jgi:hypothetical protein
MRNPRGDAVYPGSGPRPPARSALRPVLIPILTALALAAPAQDPPVRENENVDLTGGSAYGQLSVASAGGFSGVMWLSGHLNGGRSGVWVSPAGGRGVGFGAPVRLDADPNDEAAQLRPDSLRAAGDGAYAVWIDSRHQTSQYGLESELYFAASHDAGASWSAEQRLEKGIPFGTGLVTDFRFAVDGRGTPSAADDLLHLAVVASEPAASVSGVWYLRSADGGATWSTPRAIRPDWVQDLRLAVDGRHLHLAWYEWHGTLPEVHYLRSDDAGATWNPSVSLTPGSTTVLNNGLALDADGPTVAVAWSERSSLGYAPLLHATVSTDGGRHWGLPRQVGNYPAGVSVRDPDLVVRHDTVALAWADNRAMPGNDFFQAFVAATRDAGHTWFESQLSSGEGRTPRFAAAGRRAGHVVVAYTTDLVQGEVECATSRDRGLHWTTGFPVSNRPDRVLEARVAWNDRYDNAVVAWLGSNAIQRIRSFAGGFRPQWVEAQGHLVPGGHAWFEVGGFPARDEGMSFGVLVSGAAGAWAPLGGRDTGLSHDAILDAALTRIPGELSGTVQPGGVGQTPLLTIPPTMASGRTLHYAAFAFGPHGRAGSLTDVRTLTLG